MSSIKKLENPTRYRARIKRHGRFKSKTFTTHRAAITWARRVENDRELMEALGSVGAAITYRDAPVNTWASGRAESTPTPSGFNSGLMQLATPGSAISPSI